MDRTESDTDATIENGSLSGLLDGARPKGANASLLQTIGRLSFLDLGKQARERKMFFDAWMDAILRNYSGQLNFDIKHTSFERLKDSAKYVSSQLETSLTSFSAAKTMLAMQIAHQVNHLEGYFTSDGFSQTAVNLYHAGQDLLEKLLARFELAYGRDHDLHHDAA